ncbi:MAG: hypothetical protein M1484_01200 [Patescibacteria group bacterium]|nr:hypothetical protein [Patescibacteria group bacterium]MCL5431697.1 hypothetical protein [Patescibacteria group bacterium]
MKHWLSVLPIILLTAFVYRASFTAPFFQDDKILLNLATGGNLFAPIPNFPYRPISQALFYKICFFFFGLNPLGYHLALFAFFVGTVILVFLLAQRFLDSWTRAWLVAFFYALNVSLFANFFWIATSYFSIGGFFFFLTIWLYFQKNAWPALVSFILALGSNEIAFVLPLILIIASWFQNYWPKKLGLFVGLLPIFLGLRLLVGLPTAGDYSVGLNFLSPLRWYSLRAFNLPEGVDRAGPVFYLLFVALLAMLLVSLKNRRLLIFGAGFFLVGALPFFFLPAHMSSYYLTIALFGPALIFGGLVRAKLVSLFVGVYLLLTIFGLDFLSRTHWIILKNTGPIGQF